MTCRDFWSWNYIYAPEWCTCLLPLCNPLNINFTSLDMCSELQWTGALGTWIFTFDSHASCVYVFVRFTGLWHHLWKFSEVLVLVWLLGSVEWAQKDMNFIYCSTSVMWADHICLNSASVQFNLPVFLIFLTLCGPSFYKGVCSAFLVHVNTYCGGVCGLYSELSYYTCESSECSPSWREGWYFFIWT